MCPRDTTILAGAASATWLLFSDGLWIVAFGLFLWVYAPILVALRADGQPG